MSTESKTREQWLNELMELLWPRVVKAGGERPAICRASCGWPSKSPLLRASAKSRRIGECWSDGSEDEAREIFVSPALADPVEVADVLLHEMIHAALPKGTGHRHPFPRIAKKLGLKGKPTATFAGDELAAELRELTEPLGKYPHAKLDAAVRPKQTARQMKVECPDCGCVVRMARSWIERGLPTCACGAKMESVEYGADAEVERLNLRSSMATYLTTDGAYELSSSRDGQREGLWYVTHVESGRLAIRRNRADALAFIAEHREGEVEFPELEHGDDAEPEDDYLADDEVEVPDYEDGEWDPEHDEYLVAA